MFTVKFGSSDFDQHQHELAASVTNHHYGKKIIIKDEVGTGYFKVLKLPNQLKAAISNFVVNQDFRGEKVNVKDNYYLLHFNQVTTKSKFSVLLNNKETAFDNSVFSSIYLTDSKESYGLKGTTGACFNQLTILIPKTWLKENLGEIFSEELLQQYFDLREERLFLDGFDTTYRSLVDKVMNTEDNVYYLAVTQSIITVITERFFCRMENKLKRGSDRPGLLEKVVRH